MAINIFYTKYLVKDEIALKELSLAMKLGLWICKVKVEVKMSDEVKIIEKEACDQKKKAAKTKAFESVLEAIKATGFSPEKVSIKCSSRMG